MMPTESQEESISSLQRTMSASVTAAAALAAELSVGRTHARAAGDEMTIADEYRERRYLVTYSFYGRTLDIDGVLARTSPAAKFEVWRKGDARGGGRKAKTSGIQVRIAKGGAEAATRAVERFLEKNRSFLRAAARRTSKTTFSSISCAMYVFPRELTTVWLPASALKRLGELGVGWGVTGYPFHADWVKAPSNKRMQLTRSAMANSRRGPRS